MNTHSTAKLVPHIAAILASICCVVPAIAAETNFSASIFIKLAKESFLDTEEIRGKIQLKVLPGKAVPTGDIQDELGATPRLRLLFDSQLSAVPLEVAMNGSLQQSIMAGGEVEVPFEIKAWPELSQRLQTVDGIAKLRKGLHHGYAVLETFAGYGPVIGWNMRREMKWRTTIGATQHFEIIASGARSVSSEELIQAARAGSDSFRMAIASFFGDQGPLAAGDLLPIMESAGPETKGRLARLYQNRGGALEGLSPFFERPTDNQVFLDVHTSPPFFLKLAPGEILRVVCAGSNSVLHNVNGLDQNYAVLGKQEKIVHAPREPGIYRVGCDIHVSTWAWVLVTGSKK